MEKNKFGFNSKSAQEKRAKERLETTKKSFEIAENRLRKQWDEEGREYTKRALELATLFDLEDRGIL